MDTIKISIEPKYVSISNGKYFEDLFIADCQKPDCRAGKRLRKDLLPYAVEKIEYYEGKDKKPPIFEMKLSSKILGLKYPKGISKKTIHFVSEAINRIDGFELQMDGLLNSKVHEVHVVVNCLSDYPTEIMDTLNIIRCVNPKFKTDSIGGTSILYLARADYRKEILNIYYKYPELLKDTYLCKLLGKDGIEWAERNIRVELRIYSHRNIRGRFESIILKDILTYTGNPVSDVFNEIYRGVDLNESNFKATSLKEYFLYEMIQKNNGDIPSIRRIVSTFTDRTNLSKKMKNFSEVLNKIESQKLNNTGNVKYFLELQRKLSES